MKYAAAILLVACASVFPSAPAVGACEAKPDPAPAATPTPEPPIFDPDALAEKQIAWYKVVCQQSNRRMLVIFGTNACEPCRVVSRALLTQKFYDALIRQFVPVFIDVPPGSANEKVMRSYGIDPKRKLPAVLIFDNEHNLVESDAKGDLLAAAAKGEEAVQLWILGKFVKTDY